MASISINQFCNNVKHSNESILIWAHKYLTKKSTLMSLEKELEVSHSTLWWCFKHRLADLSEDMSEEVLEKLHTNRRRKTKWVMKSEDSTK